MQPTLGLRWLLCYEESDANVCHLQKAAPKHWFANGQMISVMRCPTRFGSVSWKTKAQSDRSWKISLDLASGFTGDVRIHIHPPDGNPLRKTSTGTIAENSIVLNRAMFSGQTHFEIDVT